MTTFANLFNITTTTNGDTAFVSSESAILDFFGGVSRTDINEKKIISLLDKCWKESKLLTLKAIFYKRDCREGQGERKIFEIALKWLTEIAPEIIIKNINLIPEYGSFKDLSKLYQYNENKNIAEKIVDIYYNQLKLDIESEDNISLASKWVPSVVSNTDKKKLARQIALKFGFNKEWKKQYRRMLSKLRQKLNIVERNLSQHTLDKIEFSKIPSLAMKRYRNSFMKKLKDRFEMYIENVKNGKEKINAKMLAPHEIVAADNLDDPVIIAQWNEIVKQTKQNGYIKNALAIPDTSGSMTGLPMNVSTALACLISECCESPNLKDFIISFSMTPNFLDLRGLSLKEKIVKLRTDGAGYNTDLVAVFETLLNRAKSTNLPQSEMPEKIILISDMQFDECTNGYNTSSYERIKSLYNSSNYQLPNIIFWNVQGFLTSMPITKSEIGTCLVSGFSQNILKYIMSGNISTPYELMLDVLNSERYSEIKE